MPSATTGTRLLLCACPLHCTQVLRLATAAHGRLHGLQATTDWPKPASTGLAPQTSEQAQTGLHILWALLPPGATPAAQAREHAWRSHLQQPAAAHALPAGTSIQMLYGNAAQQAQQLAPWAHHSPALANTVELPECQECLDASSEQQLFSRWVQP